ncbi:uncharacterized protein [Physcomitrium patens]|uniref:uncharacterized protein isoform X1 n=1 Tax=Physcomitrium patens TaxID=3218 RepID=UPI000D17E54C|nr:uncharacterized protein LOC112281145 isoform X1 [Physcomitrium patens]XP_024373117.1 uncharacterized protein LOC112281145 isoform X1 [Physcomitrium patens]XP_024373118.1 uncharacterized protein LOC112281145 isoform X1 [Physcomitrium patens]|eukprot:XP_024373116.1 uncharacterized protein LOC112281145 isoform X1 [Physcomitrella patens]
MAFLAVSWGISCALLAVNVIMRIINAAIAGWAFNRNMDRASTDSTDFGVRSIKFFPGVYFPLDENVPYVPSVNEGIWLPGAGNVEGKMVALYFLPIVLVASVVGIASICVGMYHLRVWRTDSLAAAVSAALIAWLLSFLAAGVACKEIYVGATRSTKLKVVEGFTVILPLFEFYYLLSLQAAALGGKEGTAYTSSSKREPREKFDTVFEDRRDSGVEAGMDV